MIQITFSPLEEPRITLPTSPKRLSVNFPFFGDFFVNLHNRIGLFELFNRIRWLVVFLFGPVLCALWASGYASNASALGVAFIYVLFGAYHLKINPRTQKQQFGEDKIEVTDKPNCALCLKKSRIMKVFKYRVVSECDYMEWFSIIGLASCREWTSEQSHLSAVCLPCSLRRLSQSWAKLILWFCLLLASSNAFHHVGLGLQLAAYIFALISIHAIVHHGSRLSHPFALIRSDAIDALEQVHGAFSKEQLMSERKWQSLDNGRERVESDEQLVASIHQKLLGYPLLATASIKLSLLV